MPVKESELNKWQEKESVEPLNAVNLHMRIWTQGFTPAHVTSHPKG